MIQNKTYESGRSMLEMLCVLAVIGVLSVGSIMGYTLAMRKHTVNEVVHAVSLGNAELQFGKKPEFKTVPGVTFDTRDFNGKPAFITVTLSDSDVCQDVKNVASEQWIVEGDCE